MEQKFPLFQRSIPLRFKRRSLLTMATIPEQDPPEPTNHEISVIKKSNFRTMDVQMVGKKDFLGDGRIHKSAKTGPGWSLDYLPGTAEKLEKSVATLKAHLESGNSVYG